ncbi:Phosphoglycerate kinase [Ruegeria sp. THAF57]|uniref:phosphoglycerate kinase n=1 Tax=Ruegeria sp. THAF57 TaxID=2744555 RepID=UPI0015E05EB9|nr:phosphoglycerate kinase [Ruegeria sp. THAF57]CAD0186813.1 Phosphoglycerate kinase [Ruegeria sp. THAF57]
MSQLTSINDVDVSGRRLLVRADLNVPMQNGQITDMTRINRFAEGMRPLLQKGAKLVVLTHRGRPDRPFEQSLSNEKIRKALSDALQAPVLFSAYSTGPSSESFASRLSEGQVLLCENVRFLKGETSNDLEVAAGLARLGEIYVNDAFSSAHRAHASTEGVTRFLPSFAGPLMLDEVDALSQTLDAPDQPAVAVIGADRFSSKAPILLNLAGKLDKLIIGGQIANTFLYASGTPIGRSQFEPDQLDAVSEIRARAEESGCKILLPIDLVVSQDNGKSTAIVDRTACPQDATILDVGPKTVERFKAALGSARAILWNGPFGRMENETPAVGLAQEAARITRMGKSITVAGGRDAVRALNQAGVSDDFSFVSTARGAFLECLSGRNLPGIAALKGTQCAS